MSEETKVTEIERMRLTFRCRVPWDAMESVGSEHVRHCRQCDLDVYNFSKMTRSEAAKVVEEHGGSLCAIIRRREDGTIITLEDAS